MLEGANWVINCAVFFGQPAVVHLGITKLTIDNVKRIIHLGPHTGIEFVGLLHNRVPRRVLSQATLSRAHFRTPSTPVASGWLWHLDSLHGQTRRAQLRAAIRVLE